MDAGGTATTGCPPKRRGSWWKHESPDLSRGENQAWLLFAYAIVVLQITAILVIAGWIGWTMATTPPPAPLEPEPVATSVSPEEKASA